MKIRITSLVAVMFSLALAVPGAARAQAADTAKASPSPVSGWRAIAAKLESMRLKTVNYDGLPLGEVVRWLREESIKQDPEKKGINFLLSQNTDTGEPATAPPQLGPSDNPVPAEQLDVNGVLIRLKPPLRDVRFLDALDAIVRVAEHPIKYSIQDYGVVFSPRAPGEAVGINSAVAAAVGEGEKLIKRKLDSIRLSNVKYDGLPLSEVVVNLMDEAIKRDPDKKGINFLLCQNAQGSAPAVVLGPNGEPTSAPPQEQIDVGTVLIRITPPLTEVRLVDVLDAVVRVAERPIQYSIEDYGVVFSPRYSEATPTDGIGFSFPGGRPKEFLDAVQRQYRVDWVSVADIPNEMDYVEIPRLRLNLASLGSLVPKPSFNTEDVLLALVSLYNTLGQQRPELGSLLVKGNLYKPSVVMFVPSKTTGGAARSFKVKAFSVAGIGENERKRLLEDIDRARDEAMMYVMSEPGGRSNFRDIDGRVAVHNETSLLVATGTERFVDMVETIVTASQARDHTSKPPAAAPTPAPGK